MTKKIPLYEKIAVMGIIPLITIGWLGFYGYLGPTIQAFLR